MGLSPYKHKDDQRLAELGLAQIAMMFAGAIALQLGTYCTSTLCTVRTVASITERTVRTELRCTPDVFPTQLLDGLLLAVLGLVPGMVAGQAVWSWIRLEGCTYCWCCRDTGARNYTEEIDIERSSMDSPSDTVTR